MKYYRKVDLLIVTDNHGGCHHDCQMLANDGNEESYCTLFCHNVSREGRHPGCNLLCEGLEPKYTVVEFLDSIDIGCAKFATDYGLGTNKSLKCSIDEWKELFNNWVNRTVVDAKSEVTAPIKGIIDDTTFVPGTKNTLYGMPLDNKPYHIDEVVPIQKPLILTLLDATPQTEDYSTYDPGGSGRRYGGPFGRKCKVKK